MLSMGASDGSVVKGSVSIIRNVRNEAPDSLVVKASVSVI